MEFHMGMDSDDIRHPPDMGPLRGVDGRERMLWEERMTYVFEFQGGKFDPDGKASVADSDAHNKAVEAAELALWKTQPAHFAAYVTDKGIGTWLGTSIGTIIDRRRYRNNLGARIEYVKVRGDNGAVYSGRYGFDWSQLVRLRRVKG